MRIRDSFGLNKEQMEAVDTEKNISLSAGAGSGKTRVLTARYLSLIEEGIGVENILAVTFTEKAALEMKKRIRESILHRISEEESMEKKLFWQRAMDNIVYANITTIHGFCSSIIKENAALVGIDFNFSILNEIDRVSFLRGKCEEILLSLREEYAYEFSSLEEAMGKEHVSKLVTEILSLLDAIGESPYSLEKIKENCRGNKVILLVLHILQKLNEAYEEYKLENDVLEYSDLQIKALKILKLREIGDFYRERFKRVLVDEFQDTNELQKEIIYKLVCEKGAIGSKKLVCEKVTIESKKLFIVGDVKQSIYGFRGADYKIFGKVKDDLGESSSKKLSSCYRSEKEIIYGINEIFKNLIGDYEQLLYKEEEVGCIQKKRITVVSVDSEEHRNTTLKELKKELRSKLNTIGIDEYRKKLQIVNEEINIPKETKREVEAIVKSINLLRIKGIGLKDIAILIRSRGELKSLQKSLEEYNVPYCTVGGIGFYKEQEIVDLLSLYKVTLQDFERKFTVEETMIFISLMRSPIVHMNDYLIYNLRKLEKDEQCLNIVAVMEKYANKDEFNEKEKGIIKEALHMLKDLKEMAEKKTPESFMKYAIERVQYRETLLTYNKGINKCRNIEKLVQIAKDLSKEKIVTHKSFLEFIETTEKFQVEESEAALDNEETNAVKIMTIHVSKGLEFKGVIIPFINKNLITQSSRELRSKIFLYNNGGVAYKLNEENKEGKYFKELIDKKLWECLNEEIRILYVAMTRAEKEIILVGDINKDKEVSNLDLKTDTYGKLLNYVLQDEKVKKSIEIVNEHELPQLKRLDNIEEELHVNKDKIYNNIRFPYEAKEKKYVSASMYMKYEECPRRYYYDSIAKTNYEVINEIKPREQVVENVVNNRKFSPMYATVRGALIHEAIEAYELKGEREAVNHINERVEEFYKNYPNREEEQEEDKDNLIGYLNTFIELKKKDSVNYEGWNLVYDENEVSYLLYASDEYRTIVPGFIDKLKVYEKDGIYKGVVIDYKSNIIVSEEDIESCLRHYETQLLMYGMAVKDLLRFNEKRIDDIELKLYFLHGKVVRSVQFNEGKARELFLRLERCFHREMDFENCERVCGEYCGRCNWRGYCGI